MFARSQEQAGYHLPPVCSFGPGGDYVRFWPTSKLTESEELSGFSSITGKFDKLLRKIGLIFEKAGEQQRSADQVSQVAAYIRREAATAQEPINCGRWDDPLFSDVRQLTPDRRSAQNWLFDDDINLDGLATRSDNLVPCTRRRHPGKARQQTNALRQELLF